MSNDVPLKSVYVLSRTVFDWLQLRSWYLWHQIEYKFYKHKTASNMLPSVVLKRVAHIPTLFDCNISLLSTRSHFNNISGVGLFDPRFNVLKQ